MTKVLAFVLAGGEGTRLRPLTAEQAKPAVHFAGGHRIVDFVLANLVNSQLRSVYVLCQYKPESLIGYMNEFWARRLRSCGVAITALRPGMDAYRAPYLGTADAVYRNLHLVDRHRPDVVAVFAADHVYRMDVRQMVRFHVCYQADVTVASVPVPLERASSFGIVTANIAGCIERFVEKPRDPQPMAGDRTRAYASMGNYLFKPSVLLQLLAGMRRRHGSDFGTDVLPALPCSGYRVVAYDFAQNVVPGVKPYEEPAYWRDIGTLSALAAARRDVEGPTPRFDLRNDHWPIDAAAVERQRSGDALPSRLDRVPTVALGKAVLDRPGRAMREHITLRGLRDV